MIGRPICRVGTLFRSIIIRIMASSLDRVWEVAEQVGICVLTSRRPDGGLRARPLEARPDKRKNCIYFATDFRSSKDDEIEADP
jgi:general stress protein 26